MLNLAAWHAHTCLTQSQIRVQSLSRTMESQRPETQPKWDGWESLSSVPGTINVCVCVCVYCRKAPSRMLSNSFFY